MITLRGQILVSRTDDDPLPPVRGFKTSPCVRSKRPRVYRHHAHMLKHMCAWCRHTRGRFECTHVDVLNPHTGFSTFFQRAATHTKNTQTHTHTHQTHTTTTNNTTTTTTHKTTHNITRRQRQRETERDRERRQTKKTSETRQEKMKEERQD